MKSDTPHRDEEAMLHVLAEHTSRRPDAGAPDEEDLRAYVAGTLNVQASRRIAQQLSESPSGRRRLLELQGLDGAGPPPHLRRRFLRSAQRLRSKPPAWRRRGVAALAALLVLALGWSLFRPPTLPSALEYGLEVRGLSEVRDAREGGELEATPSTRLSFTVEPLDVAERRVEFGLYRRDGAALQRVTEGLRVRVVRGAATLDIEARELVGEIPGRYAVWVVVARPGDLPRAVRLAPGDDPATVLSPPGRRRAYGATIALISDPLVQ